MSEELIIPGFKGTPAPWNKDNSYRIHSIDNQIVVDVEFSGNDFLERDSNTHLIASAPELLAELMDFHNHSIDQGTHDCEGIPGGCPVQRVICKALGEEFVEPTSDLTAPVQYGYKREVVKGKYEVAQQNRGLIMESIYKIEVIRELVDWINEAVLLVLSSSIRYNDIVIMAPEEFQNALEVYYRHLGQKLYGAPLAFGNVPIRYDGPHDRLTVFAPGWCGEVHTLFIQEAVDKANAK